MAPVLVPTIRLKPEPTSRVLRPAFLLKPSHCEDDAELCLAAHHASVSFGRSFEWVGFNHGTHAGQFGEVQCVFGIRRRSRCPPLDSLASTDELY